MFGNEVDIGSTPQEMQKHTQFSLSTKSSGSLEVRRVCYNEGSKGGFSLGFGLGVSSSLGIGPFQASSSFGLAAQSPILINPQKLNMLTILYMN